MSICQIYVNTSNSDVDLSDNYVDFSDDFVAMCLALTRSKFLTN